LIKAIGKAAHISSSFPLLPKRMDERNPTLNCNAVCGIIFQMIIFCTFNYVDHFSRCRDKSNTSSENIKQRNIKELFLGMKRKASTDDGRKEKAQKQLHETSEVDSDIDISDVEM
jgi:hypothetical protein